MTDSALKALWDVCRDWVNAGAFCDQWWIVSAECSHGHWAAESDNWFDLSAAWERLAESVREGHVTP